MRKYRGLVVVMVMFLAATAFLQGKDKGDVGRLVTGKVMNRADQPLTDAVVYLTDTHTKAIKTYIVGPDGAFHFPGLSLNVDYEIYGLYKQRKSDTKTVSQFDNRKQVEVNLRIDAN